MPKMSNWFIFCVFGYFDREELKFQYDFDDCTIRSRDTDLQKWEKKSSQIELFENDEKRALFLEIIQMLMKLKFIAN